MLPVRFLVAIALSVIVLFSQAIPAMAKTLKSDPTDATVQLDGIYEKAQDTLNSPPSSIKEEIKEHAGGGLNEAQGTEDINKMERSSSSKPAIVDQIEKAFDKTKKK